MSQNDHSSPEDVSDKNIQEETETVDEISIELNEKQTVKQRKTNK